MKPIVFSCTADLPLKPHEIAEQVLEPANWSDFRGYGPLPGIRHAEFESKTEEIVGSRISVHNTDGSTHVEQIVEWRPDHRLALRMLEFSPPLSRLASQIDEVWEMEATSDGAKIQRHFALHPKSAVALPVLWGLSFLLQAAIRRHLRDMAISFG